MWKLCFAIFFICFHPSASQQPCVTSRLVKRFADFAKRSSVMLRARALTRIPHVQYPSRYDVTFQVIKGFPTREDKLTRNRSAIIRLGPFGRGENCVDISLSARYILFLQKRTLFGRSKYSMTFLPIPFSATNGKYFTKVLRGNITGKGFQRSGCRFLRGPRNGRLRCTKDKTMCTALCRSGFEVKGTPAKVCDVKTMRWNTSRAFVCERKLPRTTPSTTNNRGNNTRGGKPGEEEMKVLLGSRTKPDPKKASSSRTSQQSIATSKPPTADTKTTQTTTVPPPSTTTVPPPSTTTVPPPSTTTVPPPSTTTVPRPSTTTVPPPSTTTVLPPSTTTVPPPSTATRDTTTTASSTYVLTPTGMKTKDNEFEDPTTSSMTSKSSIFPRTIETTDFNKASTVKSTKESFLKLVGNNAINRPKLIKLDSEPSDQENVLQESLLNQNTTSPIESSSTSTTTTTVENNAGNPASGLLPQGGGPANIPLLGFGALVVGCPTYEGTTAIHSVWQDGFNGLAKFPAVENPLLGGWVVRIIFSIPLNLLEVYTTDILAVSKSRYEFILVPKLYNTNLFQDLTVGFNGRFTATGAPTTHVMSRAFLLGLCRAGQFEAENINRLLPFDDLNGNHSEAWITNRTEFSFEPPLNFNNGGSFGSNNGGGGGAIFSTTSLPGNSISSLSSTMGSSVATAGRCSVASPSGSLTEGENATPDWRRTDANETVDYNELLHKSILFYEAQRSGSLPEDNRIPWRGDSDLKDGCSIQADLTGGWYNAGGNVKSTPLIAFSTTLLAWGAIDYREAYMEAGELENVLDQIRWATDYLIKTNLGKNRLVVQVGNYTLPSASWEPPEDFDPSLRPVHIADSQNPAADVASDVAAALAAASILFTVNNDSSYAETCLQHAIELYNFAQEFPTPFQSSVRNAEWLDPENGLEDDVAWSSIWLYMATRNSSYLQSAEETFSNIDQYNNLFYWGYKTRGVAILLAEQSSRPLLYTITTNTYMQWLMSAPHFTPGGLLWLDAIGTSMLAANAAFLSVKAGDIANNAFQRHSYHNFARGQLEKLVGGAQRGYVVGVGPNSPQRPFHRGSTCSAFSVCSDDVLTSTEPNPNILYGALVNGPGLNGAYLDNAGNFEHNTVSITFNAGFQSLVAGLKQISLRI